MSLIITFKTTVDNIDGSNSMTVAFLYYSTQDTSWHNLSTCHLKPYWMILIDQTVGGLTLHDSISSIQDDIFKSKIKNHSG